MIMLTGKEIKDKSVLEDALAFEGVGQFPGKNQMCNTCMESI